jgi:hypothetical protein
MATACQGHVVWLHEDERDGQGESDMADTIRNVKNFDQE